MKFKLVIAIVFMLTSFSGTAQTWNEWFRQKKTQKKYLIQQIAALKVYLKYLKEGYRVVQKGMNLVGNIKEGNFNSHKEYFGSLEEANVLISGSSLVSSTIYFEELVLKQISTLKKYLASNEELTPEERQYIGQVCEKVVNFSKENIEQLKTVLTRDELQMKDDERMERINKVYTEAKERFGFIRGFWNETQLLVMEREREKSEIETTSKSHAL
jgi:hypothetical protein